MSSLSFKQLRAIGWKPILVFVAGSLWIALFPVVYIFLYQDGDWVQDLLVGEAYWKGIPPVVGSWIGGSTSQLVLKELVACPEHIFLAVLVLDTLLVNIWTILMFQGIKKSNFLNAILRIDNKIEPALVERTSAKVLSPFWCFGILLTGVFLINVLVDQFIMQIILLSVVGLLLSNFIRSWNFHFVLKAGGLLIILVMAVLGLKLSFSLFRIETPFLLFLICWLCSHFVFMLGIAKIINLNMAWVPIASMANVGGIATAPAVTAAYNKTWMPHAVILAILSMATGTFWGMLTIFLLNNFVF